MSDQIESFKVGNLDLGGLTDADLAPKSTAEVNSDKVSFLRQPGKYNFVVKERTLSTPEGLKDGAGKQWGSIKILAAEKETGRLVKGFVHVPLESVVYTSKAGKTSNVKTQIFSRLIQSVTGTPLALSDISGTVQNLQNIITEGTEFTANVNYRRDHVSYLVDRDWETNG